VRQVVFALANLLRVLNSGESGDQEMQAIRAAVQRCDGPRIARLAHILSLLADEMTGGQG
jgi:hypothetical protein